MARLARVVMAGHPHHITQRGNGGARTFFSAPDYALYRQLLGEHCRAAGVAVWAWCRMPNHAHLVLVRSDDGRRRALASVHRRSAGIIRPRRRRTGHSWQGRFGAVRWSWTKRIFSPRSPMWRSITCERPPGRARGRLALSNPRAHLTGRDDGITALAPVRARIPDFAGFLAGAEDAEAFARLRAAESIGRQLGDERLLARLERLTRPRLRHGKRGPKPKARRLGNASGQCN